MILNFLIQLVEQVGCFHYFSPVELKVSSLSAIFLSLFRFFPLEYGIVAKTKEHLEAFGFLL